MRRFGSVAVSVAGIVFAVLAVAGCGEAQPGGQSTGSGYTNNVADLLVKIPALVTDPCRSPNADYTNCGRYVTEVANTVNALRADVPGHTAQVNSLGTAVHTYQSMACDTISGKPTPAQQTKCPAALQTIGKDLDQLGKSLAASSPSP
jgi:hypothetical protein